MISHLGYTALQTFSGKTTTDKHSSVLSQCFLFSFAFLFLFTCYSERTQFSPVCRVALPSLLRAQTILDIWLYFFISHFHSSSSPCYLICSPSRSTFPLYFSPLHLSSFSVNWILTSTLTPPFFLLISTETNVLVHAYRIYLRCKVQRMINKYTQREQRRCQCLNESQEKPNRDKWSKEVSTSHQSEALYSVRR